LCDLKGNRVKQYTLTFTVHLPDTAEDPAGTREFILKDREVTDRLCLRINGILIDEGCGILGQRVTIDEATAEHEVKRLQHDVEGLGTDEGPHTTPEDCPTWYDYCRCTVGTLIHNIKRADDAETEAKRLRDALWQYADPENWGHYYTRVTHVSFWRCDKDDPGRVARAALNQEERGTDSRAALQDQR
jgi:hypothetical protein